MACCEKYKKWKAFKHNTVHVINQAMGPVHGSLEGKCEVMGFKICEKIDKKETTLEKVLDDIIEFSRDCASREREIQMAWLTLHLALGICYEYKVQCKKIIRRFLKEILLYSRGIDMGLFMRDILHYDHLSPTADEVVKSFYCLSFTAGYMVDLEEDCLSDKIFVGPARIVYRHLVNAPKCNYLELPIGHPTLTMSQKAATTAYVSSTPLGLACESLKPKVVHVLVRHGASPIGKPIDHILSTLGSQKIVEEATGMMIGETPLEHVKECLEYCLRGVRAIKVRIEEETTGDIIKDKGQEHVHFISDRVTEFLPDDCYKSPPKLKHLTRCEIRDILFSIDAMPNGIYNLPTLDSDCKQYVDLLT